MNKPKYRYGEPLPASRLQQPASIDGVSWGDERDKIIIEALVTAPQPTPEAGPKEDRIAFKKKDGDIRFIYQQDYDIKAHAPPQTTTATSGNEHKQEATA